MSVSRFVTIFIIVSSTPGFAAPGGSAHALRPTLRFTGLGRERRSNLRVELTRALELLARHAPEEDNLTHWSGPRERLAGKSVEMIFSDSREFELAAPLDEALGDASDGAALITLPEGGQRLLIVVFVDRLLENSGHGHALDFARLGMTLAGHLFGPVQNFLNATDLDRLASRIGPEIVNREAIVFARLKFVIPMMASPEFSEFDESTRDEFSRWAEQTNRECQWTLADRAGLQ